MLSQIPKIAKRDYYTSLILEKYEIEINVDIPERTPGKSKCNPKCVILMVK